MGELRRSHTRTLTRILPPQSHTQTPQHNNHHAGARGLPASVDYELFEVFAGPVFRPPLVFLPVSSALADEEVMVSALDPIVVTATLGPKTRAKVTHRSR